MFFIINYREKVLWKKIDTKRLREKERKREKERERERERKRDRQIHREKEKEVKLERETYGVPRQLVFTVRITDFAKRTDICRAVPHSMTSHYRSG